MDTPTLDILAARERLKAARAHLATCEATVDAVQRRLWATPESRALDEANHRRAEAEVQLDLVDAELRGVALGLYNLDGQRKPCAGVEVKLYGDLEYDQTEAEAWCRQHAPVLLRLDKVRFEKVALDLGAPVKTVETPRVFIAKEL
jgi:hypothetical protein